jgi:hypothetical protein
LPFSLAGNVGYHGNGGSSIRVIRIIPNIRDWAANRPFKPSWMISSGESGPVAVSIKRRALQLYRPWYGIRAAGMGITNAEFNALVGRSGHDSEQV